MITLRVYEKLATMLKAPNRSEVRRMMRSLTLSCQHIIDFNNSDKYGSSENWFELSEERRLQALSRLSGTLLDKKDRNTIFHIDKDTFDVMENILDPEESSETARATRASERAHEVSGSPHSRGHSTKELSTSRTSPQVAVRRNASPQVDASDRIMLRLGESDDDNSSFSSSDSESGSLVESDDDNSYKVWTESIAAFLPPTLSRPPPAARNETKGNSDSDRSISSSTNDDESPRDRSTRLTTPATTARKKRRLDPDLIAIVNMLERQAQHLSRMVRKMREEVRAHLDERDAWLRQARDERRVVLEEMRLDREERRQISEQMKQSRQDRRRER